MEAFKLSRPGLFVITLRGKCQGDPDAALLTALLAEATQQRARRIWLLCHQLDTIDYRSLQLLLRAMPRLHLPTHTTLIFCGLPPGIQARFEATGLAGIVSIVPAEAYTGPRPVLR